MKKTAYLKKLSYVAIGAVLVTLFSISVANTGRVHAAITDQLSLGSSGTQVSELQQFLATNSLIYPQGIMSGYFGPLTRNAVIQFQLAYNIEPVGSVGPITRAKISAIQNSGLGLDINAPIITGPSVSVTSSSATVSWSTNEVARGKVVYGVTPVNIGNTFDSTGINFVEPTVSSGTLAPYDMIPRLTQSITIGGLMPNTTYYYVVEAIDPSLNVALSVPETFHTNQ